jgi:hypothetical protein
VFYCTLKLKINTYELHDNISTPLKCKLLFIGLREKTWQQTHHRVQRYHQNKDRTIATPIVQTPHNEWTSIRQSGTPKLYNTCLHSTRTCVNFVLCIGVLCIKKIVECFRGTPNCTGRYVIDYPMFASGVCSNIGSLNVSLI